MNLLLTGAIGVGKTSVCQRLVTLAQARGYYPQGVLTPPLYDAQGTKNGFEALDVASGRRWPLAYTDRDLGGPRIGPYRFDPRGLERALDVLRGAIRGGTDLLMVDEIGPLELERGGGFAPVLEALPRPGPGHALLVVRLALLDELRRRLEGAEVVSLTVTLHNRETMPEHILRVLWPDERP